MTSRFDWRHQYDAARDEIEQMYTDIECRDGSLTSQSQAADTDLNVIIQRFGIGEGAVPPVPVDPAYYGDFSNMPDLRTVLEIGRDAEAKFMALPARVRERFHNSAAELWEFVNDRENLEEARKLGLLKEPEPEVEIPRVRIVKDDATSSGAPA